MERNFVTNSRVINDLFAQYGNTFIAFCELINNSIQADAKNVNIVIDQVGESEIYPTAIRTITIKDDGFGVAESDLSHKILNIGTDAKNGGKGIGRFSALQIGASAEIETIAYDEKKTKYTKTILSITEDFVKANKDIAKIPIHTTDSILEGIHNTYYQVTIKNLYDNTRTEKEKKKKLDENLLLHRVHDAIFMRYPIQIFNKKVNFFVNNTYLDPKHFVIGNPTNIKSSYTDKKGSNHDFLFSYFNIKSDNNNIKIFLRVKNDTIQTIAASLEYDATWLSPKIGSWLVYIDSDLFTSDMLRNFDFEDLDENGRHIRNFIKEQLTNFFKSKNKEFDDFTSRLKTDDYYPYKQNIPSSESQEMVFQKTAYLLEEKYSILNDQSKLREVVYPLIDRSITSGNFKTILKSILKLDKTIIDRFNDLLEKAEFEDIIEFSEKVANRRSNIEFLEKITYGDIANNILERKQLHKVLEKMLWVFGERYNDSTKLLSDKNLENNLTKLREEFLTYSPDKSKENLVALSDNKLKSITDLFIYSEKIIDEENREVLVVELKAPKVKISKKELQQVKDYAYQIEQKGTFPGNLVYRILLVGTDFTAQTESEIKGTSKDTNNPYFYSKYQNKNIEIWVMKWSDLIENTKRKLKYLSTELKVKDLSVKQKFGQDFSEIDVEKLPSRLSKSKLS